MSHSAGGTGVRREVQILPCVYFTAHFGRISAEFGRLRRFRAGAPPQQRDDLGCERDIGGRAGRFQGQYRRFAGERGPLGVPTLTSRASTRSTRVLGVFSLANDAISRAGTLARRAAKPPFRRPSRPCCASTVRARRTGIAADRPRKCDAGDLAGLLFSSISGGGPPGRTDDAADLDAVSPMGWIRADDRRAQSLRATGRPQAADRKGGPENLE